MGPCFYMCRTAELFPRAVYDAELGHMVEWRAAMQQQLTETVHIPARNVAKQKALTAAARMASCLLIFAASVNSHEKLFLETKVPYYYDFSEGQLSHWICNPAYFVPVPSQDKLGGLHRKGIQHKNGGVMEVGALIVQMGWHPARLSVCLPLLSSFCTIKPRRWHVSPSEFPHEWVNVSSGTSSSG